MTWAIRQSEPELWTVGHYMPGDNTTLTITTWVALRDFDTKAEAEQHVHFLNGGTTRVLLEVMENMAYPQKVVPDLSGLSNTELMRELERRGLITLTDLEGRRVPISELPIAEHEPSG